MCRIALIFLLCAAAEAGEPPIRVLLLSGQNNHVWQETTPALERILEDTGRFRVTVTEHPERLDSELLSGFDVILSNWNNWGNNAANRDWPPAAKDALLAFVRGGRGYLSIHAGSSSFYDWPEYQHINLAAWDLDTTNHGPRHAFPVKPMGKEHPITAGIGQFEIFDELWNSAGVQPGAAPLLHAYSAAEFKGTEAWEPVLFVDTFGKGRCVNLLLGHDAEAMSNPWFAALAARSAEWAATGKVTLPMSAENVSNNQKELPK